FLGNVLLHHQFWSRSEPWPRNPRDQFNLGDLLWDWVRTGMHLVQNSRAISDGLRRSFRHDCISDYRERVSVHRRSEIERRYITAKVALAGLGAEFLSYYSTARYAYGSIVAPAAVGVRGDIGTALAQSHN